METDFKVKVGEFEGPLEILLELIEKRKLHINNVSLSQVADDFIEYKNNFQEFPISDSADFILIASTLLLIKSRSLIPNINIEREEELNIEELERRLSVYKEYRDLSQKISKIFGNFMYFAKDNKNKIIIFSPTNEITQRAIKESLERVMREVPKEEDPFPKISVDKIISLEEMMDKLSTKIQISLKTSFSEFAKSSTNKVDKVNIIVSFLAMLELVKRGILRANQNKTFDEIEMEGEVTSVPKYY